MDSPSNVTQTAPVLFVGAGPGDPELLTLKALRALMQADVIIHDRLVSPEILALVPAATRRIDVGKTGFGPSVSQEDINAYLVAEAQAGHTVVRLKGGDPTLFGRLDEEIDALTAAQISWEIIPGLTAASAAVATIGQSLTKRTRNASIRYLTGHDMKGFADHDWRALAQPGAVAAIYMGKTAARFVQGRLMMHGAAASTPLTLVENASLPQERIIASTLATWPADLAQAALSGPVLTLLGLLPRAAEQALPSLPSQEIAVHAP